MKLTGDISAREVSSSPSHGHQECLEGGSVAAGLAPTLFLHPHFPHHPQQKENTEDCLHCTTKFVE